MVDNGLIVHQTTLENTMDFLQSRRWSQSLGKVSLSFEKAERTERGELTKERGVNWENVIKANPGVSCKKS